MGLGQFIYPRYAVHIATGKAVPIARLQAGCLWYPQQGISGQVATGHVLYIAESLLEAMKGALEDRDELDAEVAVESGEPGVAHRLTKLVLTSQFAAVPRLIEAIIERVLKVLPPTQRKRLAQGMQSGLEPQERLVELEGLLHKHNIHVLVPLSVGSKYALFTDATEALLPVSPIELGLRQQRGPRLSFVVLATDTLLENRDSPWLSRATELVVLPARPGQDAGVLDFVADMPSLKLALEDAHLMGDLALAMQEATGGWPDLCDRFYERLRRLKDLSELREFLRELTGLSLSAGRDQKSGDELLALALGARPGAVGRPSSGAGAGTVSGGRGDLPDLPELRAGSEVAQEVTALLESPAAFAWAEHGRGYLDGTLTWERGLALPRSLLLARVLRGRLMAAAYAAAQAASAGARGASGAWPGGPSERRVRWLHVSDFHFTARSSADSAPVLEALLTTVSELAQAGRTVDLIFVTGDIANTGSEAEYELAERYLERLCAAAGVERGAVHMVPGNHDVHRPSGLGLLRTLDSADAALLFFEARARRPHLAKLEAFRAFYNRFYKGERVAAEGQATAGLTRVHVRGLVLGVLPLNSAWFAQDDADSGKLMLGEATVRAGLEALAREHTDLRLALLHHPLSDLSHLERRLVQERLSERMHFVLRGHLHDTEALWLSTPYRQVMEMAVGAAYQGRVQYQNRALLVEVEVAGDGRAAVVRPYPLRYELTGHDRFTLDTSVFPRSYPTYLEERSLHLD